MDVFCIGTLLPTATVEKNFLWQTVLWCHSTQWESALILTSVPLQPCQLCSCSSMPLPFLPCEQRPIGKEESSLKYPSITFILCFKLLLAGIVVYSEQLFINGRGNSRWEWERDQWGYFRVKSLIQSCKNLWYRCDIHSLLYRQYLNSVFNMPSVFTYKGTWV